MNEKTYEVLLEIVKKHESGVILNCAEKDALVYAVKHMLPHELRTSGMYTQAREFEEQYGIR